MTDKEDTSRTIFGIGREDGSVLNSITEAQQKAILDALDVVDELDAAYDQRSNSALFVPTFSKAKEKYQEVSATLPRKDVRAALLACGIKFNLSHATLSDINEMSLVRNLGMPIRWEVDDYYLNKTSSITWEAKDVRLIEIAELQSWSGSLSKLINETSLAIAIKYATAPDFP